MLSLRNNAPRCYPTPPRKQYIYRNSTHSPSAEQFLILIFTEVFTKQPMNTKITAPINPIYSKQRRIAPNCSLIGFPEHWASLCCPQVPLKTAASGFDVLTECWLQPRTDSSCVSFGQMTPTVGLWPGRAALLHLPLCALNQSGQVCTHFCKRDRGFGANLPNFPKGHRGCLSWKATSPAFLATVWGKCREIPMLDDGDTWGRGRLGAGYQTHQGNTDATLPLRQGESWML